MSSFFKKYLANTCTSEKNEKNPVTGGSQKKYTGNVEVKMAKRGTRKQKQEGGKRKGKKGTRRGLSPALKEWNQKVMKIFHEKRKSNPSYKLRDAMRDAKKAH